MSFTSCCWFVSLLVLLSCCQPAPDAALTGDATWAQALEQYARSQQLDPHGVALLVGRNCGTYADRSYVRYTRVHPLALGMRPTRMTVLAGYLVVFFSEADSRSSRPVAFPALDSLARAHCIRLETELTRLTHPEVWRIDDGPGALRVYPDYERSDPELRNQCP